MTLGGLLINGDFGLATATHDDALFQTYRPNTSD